MKWFFYLLGVWATCVPAGYGQTPSEEANLPAAPEAQPPDERDAQKLAVDQAILRLRDRLFDPKASVRDAAASALKAMGPGAKVAIPALALRLRDRDRYVRITASETLEKMGADAVPSVSAQLCDADPQVRELAARVLQKIGPEAKSAVPALTEALADEDARVRLSAVWALQDVGPEAKPAIPCLAARLRDRDGYVRTTAAQVLTRFGLDAVASLSVLLDDENPVVRALAANTLREIGVPEPAGSKPGW